MLVQCTPGGRKYAEVLTLRAPRFDFKMAVFTAEQKTLARQLIGTVTGLQSHEENFKLCFQFVKSNFRYHRFLDVDSFKVSRSIRGLVEKFSVHAQPERAQALEGLTDRFLQCPLQLEKSYPKSDTHYSILLLLLLLSDNPTATQWSHAHPDTPASHDVGDDFDWAAYLREGIEFASFSDSDSEWSQLSEEEEETEAAKETQTDSAVGEDISEEEEEEEGTADKLVQVSRSRSWMLEHVVVPYWNQSHPYHHPSLPAPPPSSTHPSCTLSSQWRSHREAVDPLFFPAEVVTVAETNIMRETLWVLLGAERSFVYTLGEGVRREGVREEGVRGGGEGVGVRRGVQVSHLTPLALHRQLQQFASVATLLLKLRRFIEATISNMCNSPSPSSPPPSLTLTQCQTYEAAADGLTYCLQKFDDQLIEIERRIVERKAFVSLLMLSTELHPAFTQIQLLYNVFSVVLRPPGEDNPSPAPHQCSVRLLDSLWNGMQYYDTLGEAGRITVHQLFPLWVMCVRPYLSMIGRWMVEGYLEDRHGELCVVRSKTVVAKTGDYWNTYYSVVQPVPVFLQPVIHKVMLAGKSVDLIESTGKLRMMEEMTHSCSLDVSSSHPPTSPSSPPPSPTSPHPSTDLYEELLLLLREELLPVQEEEGREGGEGGGGGGGEGGGGGVEEGERKGEEGEGEEGEQEKEEEEERDREQGGVRERQEESEQQRETSQGTIGGGGGQSRVDPAALPLELHGMSPLLQQYLLSLSSPHPPIISSSRLLWEELNTIKAFPQHTPITVMIQKCLYPLIFKRYKKSSGCLMHILQSEFHLMDHLRTVQLFLLMEAGDTLHHFCSDIFLRVQHGEPWHDLLYLNSLLQDVLLPHYPHLERKLTVLLDDQNCSKDLLHSITAISLHYEVPWPLDTVFSQPLMDMYNEVFHLLLQVKWAKWSLEGIQTKEYSSAVLPPDQSFCLHQLLLLRSKLLHFVNSLYNYLMTRILHSIGLEYQQKMAQAEDLDAVISLHTEYVTTIFDRCLLNRKASIVKEAILKTLRLALTYRQKWEKGLSQFSHAEAAGVESEFLKCSHFLTTCLNKTVKRGTFPYLETLAFSLNTLKTDQKIFGNRTKTT